MHYKSSSPVFLFLAVFLLTSSSDAADPSLGAQKQPPNPSHSTLSTSRSSVGRVAPEDQSILLWEESERVNVSEGQIRDVKLKPEIKISRNEFFARYGVGLGMRTDDSIVEFRTYQDKWEFTLSRFQHLYRGLKVLGADYVLQEKNGAVLYAIGKIGTGLNLDITPQISEAQALEFAKTNIGAQTWAWETMPQNYTVPKGELAISSKGFKFTPESFRLVYKFSIQASNPFGSYEVHVDAKTGEIINKISNIRQASESGSTLET